jgi:hypothetical protein
MGPADRRQRAQRLGAAVASGLPTKPFCRADEVISRRHEGVRKPILVIKGVGLQRGHIMISFPQKTFRQAGLTVALAIGLCAASTSSFAFSPEAQQMCTGDAFRLCSSAIPNVSAVTACMLKQRANLSAGCRTVMDRDLAQQSRKVATQ